MDKIIAKIKPLTSDNIESLRWDGFVENSLMANKAFEVTEKDEISAIKVMHFTENRNIAICLDADSKGGEIYVYNFKYDGTNRHKVIKYINPRVYCSYLVSLESISWEDKANG